jgi:pyrrolidone-carboxylate peptidase
MLNDELQIELNAKSKLILESRFNVSEIISKLEANSINYMINKKPSNYLCNYAYYRFLEIFKGNAILIHIPYQIDFLI